MLEPLSAQSGNDHRGPVDHRGFANNLMRVFDTQANDLDGFGGPDAMGALIPLIFYEQVVRSLHEENCAATGMPIETSNLQ